MSAPRFIPARVTRFSGPRKRRPRPAKGGIRLTDGVLEVRRTVEPRATWDTRPDRSGPPVWERDQIARVTLGPIERARLAVELLRSLDPETAEAVRRADLRA